MCRNPVAVNFHNEKKIKTKNNFNTVKFEVYVNDEKCKSLNSGSKCNTMKYFLQILQ